MENVPLNHVAFTSDDGYFEEPYIAGKQMTLSENQCFIILFWSTGVITVQVYNTVTSTNSE